VLSEYLAEFLLLAIVHLLALMSPGPDFAIAIRQSTHYGRKAGIITAIGIGSGIGVHVIYTLIGVSALILANNLIKTSIEIIGSSYLLYLGGLFIYATLKKPQMQTTNASKPAIKSASSSFWLGFLTNATNPKAFLFFLAIFTSTVNVETPLGIKIFYGIWMCVVTTLWFSLVSLIFTNKIVAAKFMSFNVWFERITGLFLISVALYMLSNLFLSF